MIDPRLNRLDYGEQLRPPPGYRLDRAIAATYGADLATLLSVPVALIHAQTLEGDFTGARIELLDAIKRFATRTRVFHQAGQLHVPRKLNWLYAHLEQTLVPIRPSGPFSSFHPKCWILRFERADDHAARASEDALPVFRVIVLSRNLTFDASWDLAASLEGSPGAKIEAANAPLVEFLGWLDSHAPDPDFPRFSEELRRTPLSVPAPFDRLRFHPLGLPGRSGRAPFLEEKAARALVMSPFLHADTLRAIHRRVDHLELYSNRHELRRFPPGELAAERVYQFADALADLDLQDLGQEPSQHPAPRHLHAKLFVFEDAAKIRCFLGSANATRAAVERNVELMLELEGKAGPVSVSRLRRMLCGESDGADAQDRRRGPFEPYVPPPETTGDEAARRAENELRELKHRLISAPLHGVVRAAGDTGAFTLTVSADLTEVRWTEAFEIAIQPFNVALARKPVVLAPGMRQEASFENLGEVELSRFLHFRIRHPDLPGDHAFLLCVPVDGLPADRLDRILRRLIDSQEKFFSYLKFLLSDEITKEDLLGASLPEPGSFSSDGGTGGLTDLPVFEQLLVACSRHPERLREVDELIGRLDRADTTEGGAPVVPAEFLNLWTVFRRALDAAAPSKKR